MRVQKTVLTPVLFWLWADWAYALLVLSSVMLRFYLFIWMVWWPVFISELRSHALTGIVAHCCVSLIFFLSVFLIWLTIVLGFFIMVLPSFWCHYCVMLPLEVRALCLVLFFVGLCCAACVALFTCCQACCLVLSFFLVSLCCAVCVVLSWGKLPCAFFSVSLCSSVFVVLFTCHQACWPSLQSTSVCNCQTVDSQFSVGGLYAIPSPLTSTTVDKISWILTLPPLPLLICLLSCWSHVSNTWALLTVYPRD